MAAIIQVDPLRAYNFKLEIGGIIAMHFQECSGLDSHTATIDYREGGERTQHVRKIPGLRAVSAITLKRGLSTDSFSTTLWDWYQSADRRQVSIMLLDEGFEEKIKWDLENAWPTKWVGPAFNATASALALETLELSVESVKRAKVKGA